MYLVYREIMAWNKRRHLSGILLSTILLFTGACGEDFNVFSSVGDDVTLPCANVVYPNCSSTTWLYDSPGSTVTIEEVIHGKISDESDRPERLKVESGCSLHISQIRAQDAGRYICLQYLKKDGPQHGRDARVFLSILKISSSIPVTELRNGSTLTLTCLLNSHERAGCESGHRETRLQWVDSAPAQVEVKSPCNVTLTVTLKREDHRRELVCQHIVKGEVKISLHYIITLSGIDENSNTVILTQVVPGLAAGLAVCLVVALLLICKKRQKNQVVTPMNTDQRIDNVTCAVINPSNKPPANLGNRQPADTVIYATVKPPSAEQREDAGGHADPGDVYATVNKTN